jgi:hypothetical protein
MVPLMERDPSLIADAGLSLVQRYVALCGETERKASQDLLTRRHDLLVSSSVLGGGQDA